MLRKHLAKFALLPVILTGLAACAQPGSADGTIRMGALMSLTGSSAFTGVAAKNGLEIASQMINEDPAGYLGDPNRDFEVEFRDSGADVATAINAFRGYVNNPSVLVAAGPSASTQALAVGPFAQQVHLPLIVPHAQSSTVTDAGDQVFQVSLVGDRVVTPLVEHVIGRDVPPSRVCISYTSDNQGNTDLGRTAEKLFAESGVDVTVGTVLYNDTNFTSTIAKFRSAGCDAVYLVMPSPSVASFMVQADQSGFRPTFLGVSTFGAAVPDTQGVATGSLYTSDYNVDLDTSLNREFVERYTAAFGKQPDIYAAQAFSTAMIVAAAAKELPGEITREQFATQLAGLRDVEVVVGADGRFSFDESRRADYLASTLEVREGGRSEGVE